MALYDIITNNPAVASDVEQIINAFNGKHDIGSVNFAPALSAPSSSSFSVSAVSGSGMSVGAYNYQFTLITGQYKSDGITLVQTGETLPSGALTVTTLNGSASVRVTFPSTLATSAIAINIYRTSVGGSDYKLVATVKAGGTSYTDTTADGSRGSQTPPTSNSTGTNFSFGGMVSAPNNIFSLALGVANQSLPASTDTGITLSPSGIGVTGDSSWSTSTWTCPVGGIYLISFNANAPIPSGAGLTMKLFVNGALDQYLSQYWNSSTGTQTFGSAGTALKKLNAGDTLRFYANPTMATTFNGNYSRCIIVKVG